MTETEWKMNFIKNLRVKLIRKGWNQTDLAEAAKVSRTTIGRYLRGDRVPDSYILTKIALALDCSMDDLVGN